MKFNITKKQILYLSQASPASKLMLEQLFPKAFEKELIIFSENAPLGSLYDYNNIRIGGIEIGKDSVEPKFKGKSFVLSNLYDWEIIPNEHTSEIWNHLLIARMSNYLEE